MTELTTARLQMRLFTLDDDDKLVRLHGEDDVLTLMEGLRKRLEFGEFRADRTIQ